MNLKVYLTLAIPFMISTMTQPLLGAVDTAVVGRLGEPSYIGGVAIGAVVFNTMYWIFGFLRVSTSGFSAQSLGSQNTNDSISSYFRPLIIAVIISCVLFIASAFIKLSAVHIYAPAKNVMTSFSRYYDILVWGIPCVLIGYVNLGWLMGRKHVREVMILQISTNCLNIVLDIVFVVTFKMGVSGVAYATLISQVYGLLLGLFLIFSKISIAKVVRDCSGIIDKKAFIKIFGVNADLIIRTICLLVMTNLFLAKGSHLGIEVLAANAILFQIQYLLCYLYDGMANATSVLIGKSVGENNIEQYYKVVKVSNQCTVILSIILLGVLVVTSSSLISVFTQSNEIIRLCKEYIAWLYIFPFVVGYGLVYYGVYIGATYTRPIRNSMMISLTLFVVLYYFVVPEYLNHGLWFAFLAFCLCRSCSIMAFRKQLVRDIFIAK